MAFSASKVSRLGADGESDAAGGATGLVSPTEPVPAPPSVAPARSAWAVPWLAGLTLAVLYLLYRSFA